jgi:hypothetical protein
MQTLTLVYQGPLKSNGKAEHKAIVREQFSRQLRPIYERDILRDNVRNYVKQNCVKEVAVAKFTSLANKVFGLHARIDVTMLSIDNAGIFSAAQGDIDNRLKTLFDALSIPPESQASSVKSPLPDLTVCLVEDDRLIRDVRVRVGELLLPVEDKSTVLVIINTTLIRHDEISGTIFEVD